MTNLEYEIISDIHDKKCYTCYNHGNCEVLNKDVPCEYRTSKEAKDLLRKIKNRSYA